MGKFRELLESVGYTREEGQELQKAAQVEAKEYFENVYLKEARKAFKGFKEGKGYYGGHEFRYGEQGDDDYIMIELSGIVGNYWQRQDEFDYLLDGEVNYGYLGKTYMFGQRGVSPGIMEESKELKKMIRPAALLKQIKKEIKQKQSRIKGSVELTIQGSNFKLQPKYVQSLKADLAKGKEIMLMPAGMGTGYRISKKRFSGRFGTGQLDSEASKLFGISKLYYQEFDAD